MAITSEHALDRDARMRPWLAIRPHYVLLTIFLVAFPLVANGFWTVEAHANHGPSDMRQLSEVDYAG